MKACKIVKFLMHWLVLGTGLSIVQPVMGQSFPRPLFQYAIFYDGLLEFSDCATMTINNGPVHCNTNIFTGSPSALTFNSIVTTSGNITSPANAGFSAGSWTGHVTYNGSPSPGYFTGQPTRTLPIGTNGTQGSNLIQILYPSNNTQNAAMISQLYITKAHLILMISNTTFTATFRSDPADVNPYTFGPWPLAMLTSNSWVNNQAVRTNSNWGTNWGWNWNWLSTNTFYDWRESTQMAITSVDVNKLTNWMNTWLTATYNTNISGKFSANNPFNIIYIADWRATNASASHPASLSAIRLLNGSQLPATGLTFATPDPLYIQGIYNCPVSAYQGTTNTTLSAPASVACDALTILSPSWNDANAANSASSRRPNASSDTVNCAIIAGNVPSTGSGSTQYSGGANNLPRLLENWSGDTLTLNTSLICLYPSARATVQFQLPGLYYSAPTRNFNFDQNFTSLFSLPPGTPLFSPIIVTNTAVIELDNLVQTYNGTALAPRVSVYPPGLNVTLQYAPGNCGIFFTNAIDAGFYLVVATVNDPVYSGVVSNFFYIDRAVATVAMSNLAQTYDGTFKKISLATTPPGLQIYMTYGEHTVYVDAGTNPTVGMLPGSYPLIATVNDYNYFGSATNTLVIFPAASLPVTVAGSPVVSDGTFQLRFTNTPGARFSILAASDLTAALTNWTLLGSATEGLPGEFQFTDLQATNLSKRFYVIRSP